jgi:hypothetical protein
MNRIKYYILTVVTILTFSGCRDNENDRTLHPEEAGILLTMDWSNITGPPPSSCQARSFSAETSRLFENLDNETNRLVIEPGDAILLVYNLAEHISLSGKKATVDHNSAGVVPDPGHFFSYSGQVYIGHNGDVALTALMRQQTGDLKLSFAIKPAAMINQVKQVDMEMTGIASGLNMETNALSDASSISVSFSKNAYYAEATIRLFGFDLSTEPLIRLKVKLENGRTVQAEKDLSALVKDFNPSKSSLFSLSADMYLSEDNIILDNWACNTQSRYLSVSASEVTLPGDASGESVTVTTDQPSWVYSFVETGNWLTIKQTDTQLEISASENTGTDTRQATIYVSAGSLSKKITVTQERVTVRSYVDKEVVQLQRATVGNGINIVLMGDGYTIKEMTKGSGKYEKDMRKAAEHFLSVYPYTRYKDYFNIYMVTAISNEEGISNESTGTAVDTKFESVWEGGRSTGIACNQYTAIDYVYAVPELSSADLHDITVIMPINADIYAGTCSMFYPDHSSGYSEGFSISMCPTGWEFERIVVHEAGGHGFSKVLDEYIYYPDEMIPSEYKESIIYHKELGWYENVDFYSDISQTSWKGFVDHPKYSMVGTFEGAYMYGKGIWRPEYNSCMNNSIPYFNAPTRWAQVRRIMHLAGFDYSFERFLQEYLIPKYPAETRSKTEDFRPLAPPVTGKLDPDRIRRIKQNN